MKSRLIRCVWLGLSLSFAVISAVPLLKARQFDGPVNAIGAIFVPGGVGAVDILFVDQARGRLYVADRTKAAVHIVDAVNDVYVDSVPGFVGALGANGGRGGPNGVVGLQPLFGLGRLSGRGSGRHQTPARPRRTKPGQHVRHEPGRSVPPQHPRSSPESERGSRRAGKRRGNPGHLRPDLVRVPQAQTPRMERVPSSGFALGGGAVLDDAVKWRELRLEG